MGISATVILQIIYIVMQVLEQIWQGPVGDLFRVWYKSHTVDTGASPKLSNCETFYEIKAKIF